MYTQLYQDIIRAINGAIPALGIKWIDLFADQIKNYDEEHPFPRPALFVEFVPDVEWERQVLGVKSGTLQIRIHIAYDKVADTYFTHAGGNAAKQSEGLKNIVLVEKVKGKLTSLQSPGFYTKFKDSGVEFDSDNQILKDDIITFETEVRVMASTNQPATSLYDILNPTDPTGSASEVIATVNPNINTDFVNRIQ